MSFTRTEAAGRAKQWANETGKPQIVYQDECGYFLATSLERYNSDPQGYKRVSVLEIIQPEQKPV
ncbi:hypothetical protein ACQ4M3_07405 [Leptolyngbya sp. AN03gr2]|uniref:hypothetical protein n=1 Tax=unclassified Leptolyngbya TaxID=2650499 RepID=UPI003D315BE5